MKSVYVVQHVAREDADDEDVKFIGVYSSNREAEKAVARLIIQPGFSTYPKGFYIDKCELNKDNWTEGFITVN